MGYVFAPSRGMWSVLGRKLKEYSKELGYEVRQIDDEHYGKINAYHVGAINAFRRRLDICRKAGGFFLGFVP